MLFLSDLEGVEEAEAARALERLLNMVALRCDLCQDVSGILVIAFVTGASNTLAIAPGIDDAGSGNR